MENKGISLGKNLLRSIFYSLEKILNIDDDLSEEEEYNQDFLNIKYEVSREISDKKKSKELGEPVSKSKRKTVTPLRYGYDE